MNVLTLQTRLQQAGQNPGALDGVLGKMTFRALLLRLAPDAPQGRAVFVADALAVELPAADIWAPRRIEHFLAQALHETGGLKWLKEFGGDAYFAKYDGRMGNTKPGDGARYCGRGIFQLTGHDNYAHFGPKIGVDLLANPDQAMDPATAVKIACAYWNERGISTPADADDLEAVTRKINGGVNGIEDRRAILARIKALWGEI